MNEKLAEFVSKETKMFHDERDAALINQLKNSELNVDGIVKNWEKLFKVPTPKVKVNNNLIYVDYRL